jgi:hypothetical protein
VGQAIGQSLPMAVGIALSPVPIIAVVIMLTTQKAKLNGPSFLFGWLAGLAVAGVILLIIGGSLGASHSGKPVAWASWLDIALGFLLILVGVREFRNRPRGSDPAPMPGWMSRVDRVNPLGALGLAALLVVVNPKNLLLVVGGAAAIAKIGIAGWQQVVAYVVFAVVASAGIGTPVLIFMAKGKRAAGRLARLKDWMSRENAVILSVLCLLIAAKLIGDAISALVS